MPKIDENDRVSLGDLLIGTLNEEKGTQLMTSLAERWEQQGMAKGVMQGKELGIAQGMKLGEAELVKMMHRKGSSIDEIADLTELSISRVQELINLPLKN